MSQMTDFERSLAGLAPQSTLDRDDVVFRAGVRAGRRPWRSVFPLILGLALGAGGMAMIRPLPTAVSLDPPASESPGEPAGESPLGTPIEPLSPSSVFALQRCYLRGDFDGAMAYQNPIDQATETPTSLLEQRRRWLTGDRP